MKKYWFPKLLTVVQEEEVLNWLKGYYKDAILVNGNIELTSYDFEKEGDSEFWVGYLIAKALKNIL